MSEARVRDTRPIEAGEVEVGDWEPVPVIENPLKGRSKYPFERLEVKHVMRIKRPKVNVKSALRTWAKKHGGKYVCRDAGGGWTKIWRFK